MKKSIKIILVILLVLILLYGIYVVYEYCMFDKLYKLASNLPELDNVYFEQDTSRQKITYYKLNDIAKMQIESKNGEGTIVAWNDYGDDEYCNLFTKDQTYNTVHCVEYSVPYYDLTKNNWSVKDKLIMAMKPTENVTSAKYNGYDCYKYTSNGQVTYIEKENGIIVYEKLENEETITKFTVNTVMENDVEKPTTDGFTFKKI